MVGQIIQNYHNEDDSRPHHEQTKTGRHDTWFLAWTQEPWVQDREGPW